MLCPRGVKSAKPWARLQKAPERATDPVFRIEAIQRSGFSCEKWLETVRKTAEFAERTGGMGHAPAQRQPPTPCSDKWVKRTLPSEGPTTLVGLWDQAESE